MKQIFFLLLTALSCVFAKESKQSFTKSPTIKALLSSNSDGALIEIKGGYRIYNPLDRKLLSIGFTGKKYFAHGYKEGIKWGEGFPGIYQIQIIPSSEDTSILINGIEHRGIIEIYSIEDKVHIVNELPIELYVNALMSQSFAKSSMPPSILEALAIIFRTNAYCVAQRNIDSFWHVDAEAVNYKGYGLTKLDPDIDQAVEKTAYTIMTYKQEPFFCSYTRDCAGTTASFSTIYRKNLPCPIGINNEIAKNHREFSKWNYTITSKELAELIHLPRITEIDLFLDKDSNKCYGMRFKNQNNYIDFTYLEIKELLGDKNIQSSDFVVQIKDGVVTFEGAGQGDGCGLCLFTAEHYATKGYSASDLLSDFFPLTYLQKIESFATTSNKPN